MGGTIKQKILFAAATYLYCIYRLSGFLQISFNFTTRRFESSLFATIYSTTILVWFTICYPQHVRDFQSGFDDQIDSSRSPIDRRIYSYFTRILIVVNMIQILSRNRLKDLLNRIINVLGKVKSAYPNTKVKIRRWIVLNIFQSCIIHIVYFIVLTNMPVNLVEDTIENRLRGFLVIIPGAFFLILTNGATNVLTVLIFLFLKVNQNIASDQDQLEDQLDLHWELCLLQKKTCHLVSHLLLSVLIYIFCVAVMEAYLVYVYLAEWVFLGNTMVASGLFEAMVVLFIFVPLLMIHVIVCSKCTSEMKSTPQMISDAYKQSTDVHIKTAVEMCLFRCSVLCQSDFMIYNMFAVNFNLVYEMMGTIISYIIVMVQIYISNVLSQ